MHPVPPGLELNKRLESVPRELGEYLEGGDGPHPLYPVRVVAAREHGQQHQLLPAQAKVLDHLSQLEHLHVLLLHQNRGLRRIWPFFSFRDRCAAILFLQFFINQKYFASNCLCLRISSLQVCSAST